LFLVTIRKHCTAAPAIRRRWFDAPNQANHSPVSQIVLPKKIAEVRENDI
jgi:hypothetical protein